MRTIKYEIIRETIKHMCIEANYNLPEDTLNAYKKSIAKEESSLGKSILEKCLENAELAAKEKLPICQDTGFAVFFINIGSEVYVEGGLLTDAVNDGVRDGYKDGYLRKSILKDPLYERVNTGDNTPAIVHVEIVEGSNIDITFAPKGGGAENMSRVRMLKPSAGERGVIDFVVESVVEAGGNPCPPTVVGVGIGGTFEKAAYLAKKALLYPVGKPNANSLYNELEQRILEEINRSGVGPQGLGGNITSFFVHIETFPCHLASLPVAVNINCHAHRHIHKVL